MTSSIAVLAVISAVVSTWSASGRMEEYFIKQGERIAENFAAQSTLALLYQSPENAEQVVQLSLSFPAVGAVEIVNLRFEPLLSAGPMKKLLPVLQKVPDKPQLISATASSWVFAAPVMSGDQSADPFELAELKPKRLGSVIVLIDKDPFKKMWISLVFGNLLITGGIAVGLMYLAFRVADRLITPLNQLSSFMREAKQGSLAVRAIVTGPADIEEMAEAFNGMMTSLESGAEKLTKSRDEALRLAQTKAQFASTVSHEIRTPLNGVIGSLDMLAHTTVSAEQSQYLSLASSSAQTLIDLLNNILDFSKMEAGKFELENTDFDLTEVIEKVISTVVPAAAARNNEIGYFIDRSVPGRIVSDPLRLGQVLLNLVGNAVKFTENGDIRITVTAEDHFLRFAVLDTGLGMTWDQQQHLFQSFVQADPSTTRKFGGTGLGLAISKRIVELLGGEITVNSRLDLGSEFTFTIRLNPSLDQMSLGLEEPMADLSVLVSVSSPFESNFIVEAISRFGADVRLCASKDLKAHLIGVDVERLPYNVVVIDAGAVDDRGAALAPQLIDVGVGVVNLVKFGDQLSDPGSAIVRLMRPLGLKSLKNAIIRAAPVSAGGDLRETAKMVGPLNLAFEPRVLVVEDNQTNRSVVQSFLRKLGCNVSFAANGREGVDLAKTARFDLILMDCNMQEMDGYQATEAIRKSERTTQQRVTIVAVTANTQPDDRRRCLDAGMDDYIAKPIRMQALTDMMLKWLPQSDQVQTAEASVVEVESDLPVLDESIFGELKEVMGEAISEAIDPFLEDAPRNLRAIQDCIRDNEMRKLVAVIHSIKGAASNIGAARLAAHLKVAEEAAKAADTETISRMLPAIEAELGAATERLKSEIIAGRFEVAPISDPATVVLVCDDDRSTRAALRRTLEKEHLKVVEAASGREAIAILTRERVDVALLDAVMPDLDGFETCSYLNSMHGMRSIPVIMATALNDKESVERAYQAGAVDFVTKPFHLSVLAQRVISVAEADRNRRKVKGIEVTDALTGLNKRAVLIAKMDADFAADPSQGSLIYVDVQGVKAVNASHGHDAGDLLLRAVAERMTAILPDGVVLARVSGDEFAVFGRDIDMPLLQDRLSLPYTVGEQTIHATIRVTQAQRLYGESAAQFLQRTVHLAN